MSETKKRCPLLLMSVNQFTDGDDCGKERCAWWDENSGKCAVLTVARNLEQVNETITWATRVLH